MAETSFDAVAGSLNSKTIRYKDIIVTPGANGLISKDSLNMGINEFIIGCIPITNPNTVYAVSVIPFCYSNQTTIGAAKMHGLQALIAAGNTYVPFEGTRLTIRVFYL